MCTFLLALDDNSSPQISHINGILGAFCFFSISIFSCSSHFSHAIPWRQYLHQTPFICLTRICDLIKSFDLQVNSQCGHCAALILCRRLCSLYACAEVNVSGQPGRGHFLAFSNTRWFWKWRRKVSRVRDFALQIVHSILPSASRTAWTALMCDV